MQFRRFKSKGFFFLIEREKKKGANKKHFNGNSNLPSWPSSYFVSNKNQKYTIQEKKYPTITINPTDVYINKTKVFKTQMLLLLLLLPVLPSLTVYKSIHVKKNYISYFHG